MKISSSALVDALRVVKLTKLNESYEMAGIIWKSYLHPRDHEGKFAKKGFGMFTLLADLKSGNYSSATTFNGASGFVSHHDYIPSTHKVGGVTVEPPEGLGYAHSLESIDWALAPGESVHRIHGGPEHFAQSGVVVRHDDGSAKVLLPTPEGEAPKIGLQSTHFSVLADELAKNGYSIDAAPIDINEHEVAAKYNESVAALEKAKEAGDAPESAYGKHFQDIHDDAGNKLGHIEKTPDGKFTSHDPQGNKIGNTTKHLATAVEKVKSGKLTTPETYEHKKATSKPEPEKPKPNPHFKDITNDNGEHIGHIEKTPDGKFTSHDAQGEKIANTAKHLDTAIAKVHYKHEQDTTVAKALGKTHTPAPVKKVEVPQLVDLDNAGAQKYAYNGKLFGVEGGYAAKDKNTHLWDALDEEKKLISGGHTNPTQALNAIHNHVEDNKNKQFIFDAEGNSIGYVMRDGEKWASYSDNGDKLGYTVSGLDKAVEKVKANAGTSSANVLEKTNDNQPTGPTTTYVSPNGVELEVPEGYSVMNANDMYVVIKNDLSHIAEVKSSDGFHNLNVSSYVTSLWAKAYGNGISKAVYGDLKPSEPVISKAKKTATTDPLPDTFSFPNNGKTTKPLKAGNSIWATDDPNLFIHLTSKKELAKYDADGDSVYIPYDQTHKKYTEAALKKLGYTKVAAGPEIPTNKTLAMAVPQVEVSTEEIPSSASELIEHVYSITSNINWGHGFLGQYALKDAKLGQALAEAHTVLVTAKAKLNDDLSKSDKTFITKVTNQLAAGYAVHTFYKRLKEDPEWIPTKAELAQLAVAADKADTLSYKFGVMPEVNTLVAERNFAASMTDLGFDLNTGTHEQFSNYALSNGAVNIGGMSEQDVKNWVYAHLGKPGTHSSQKAELEASAAHILKYKAFAVHADQVLAKKNALADSKDVVIAKKAVAKKAELEHNIAAKLHRYYESPNGGGWLAYDSNGEWRKGGKLVGGPFDPTHFSPSEVKEFLANNPEYTAAGSILVGSNVPALRLQLLRDDWPGLNVSKPQGHILKSLGSNLDAHSPDEARQAWLEAYLRGDQLAMYHIDNNFAKVGPFFGMSHPGGPANETGILARQTLANWLAAQEWWSDPNTTPFDKWSEENLEKGVEELGLNDSAYAVYGDALNMSAQDLMRRWWYTHDDLPHSTSVESVESATITAPDGSLVELTPGDLVGKSTLDGYLWIYHLGDKSYSYYSKNPVQNKLHSPWPIYDASKSDAEIEAVMAADHAKLLQNSEYVDATPNWQGAPVAAGFKSAISKPSHVSEEAWKIVQGAEEDSQELHDLIGPQFTSMSDTEVLQAFARTDLSTALGAKFLSAPTSIKKLALFANSQATAYDVPSPAKDLAKDIIIAIQHNSNSNFYVDDEIHYFPTATGPIPVPPGYSLYKPEHISYYILHSDDASFRVLSSGSFKVLPGFAQSQIADSKLLYASPASVTFAKATKEGQGFSEGHLDALNGAEAKKVWTHPYIKESATAWNMNEALKSQNADDKYFMLVPKIHNYPVGVKQFALESAMNNDLPGLDALMWKDSKGIYALQPTVVEHSLVDPNASYAHIVASGSHDFNYIDDFWPSKQINDFLTDYGISPEPYSSEQSQQVADKLAELKAAAPKQKPSVDPLSDYPNLQLEPTGKDYDGMHEKTSYSDQFGREWLAKYYPHDPNSIYRLEAEHYANVIGRLFGFNSAESYVGHAQGRPSIIQKIVDNNGNFSGVDPSDLSTQQLSSAMQEHVLDWLYSNHDSHYGNLLRHPNGNSVIGIDKGQAFKHLQDDELAVGYLPPENGAPVWYDKFYNALRNGSIDEATANEVANAVLIKAYQMQSRYDARYRELVEQALTNRTFWPAELPDKNSFVTALMDRKHSLVSDFEKLYKDLFDKAGYSWNIDTESYGKNINGAVLTNSPAFATDIKDAKGYGKSLMLGSADVEDQHMIFTHMHQKNGKDGLLGSLKLRAEADARVTMFAKSLISGKLDSTGSNYSASDLPLVDNFHAANVNYLKTVNNHAPNGGKIADGEYTSSTVTQVKAIAMQANVILRAIEDQHKIDPTKVVPSDSVTFPLHVQTLEQQDALYHALNEQQAVFDTIRAAHDEATSVKVYAPAIGHLEAPVAYVPTPNLSLNKDAVSIEVHSLPTGEYAIKTTDGGHYFADALTPNASKTWASQLDYNNAISDPKAQWLPANEASAPSWVNADGSYVATQTPDGNWVHTDKTFKTTSMMTNQDVVNMVSASPDEWTFKPAEGAHRESVEALTNTKKITVSHRESMSGPATFDLSTRSLKETGAAHSDLHTGYEYVIEHDNVKVHYRPWTEPGVKRAQQGLMSIEIKDWDGSHNQIDNVLDTMNLLGVDVSPATRDSLELGYLRQMTDVLRNRADTYEGNLVSAVDEMMQLNPHMSPDEELDKLRALWDGHLNGRWAHGEMTWAPRFENYPGVENGGRPYWLRPDVSIEELKDLYRDGGMPHTHKFERMLQPADREDRLVSIMSSGRLLATEERLRVLGPIAGLSSEEDQEKGSSGFVFTRQNKDMNDTSEFPGFVLDPRTALHHTNYAYANDHYGDLDERKNSSYHNPDQMYTHGFSDNELLVKNEAKIVAAVIGSDYEKESLLKRLEAEGFTELDGVPMADVIFTEQEWEFEYKNFLEKLWKDVIEREKRIQEGEYK